MREATTRAQDLSRPSQEEILTATYERVMDEVPTEWRARVTNTFRSARGSWLRYAGEDMMQRLSILEQPAAELLLGERPVGARPLTGVRIDQIIRAAAATPESQKAERRLERLQNAAAGAAQRFYAEALAANPALDTALLPEGVQPQLPDLQQAARRIRRHVIESGLLAEFAPPPRAGQDQPAPRDLSAVVAGAAAQGRELFDLATDEPGRLALARPNFRASDRETLRTFAYLVAAAAPEASTAQEEQIYAWYWAVGAAAEDFRRREATTQAQTAGESAPEPSPAERATDAEWTRYRFMVAAAATNPDMFRSYRTRLSAVVSDPDLVERALSEGLTDRERANRSTLDSPVEQVYDAVMKALPPDDDATRRRVTGGLQDSDWRTPKSARCHRGTIRPP